MFWGVFEEKMRETKTSDTAGGRCRTPKPFLDIRGEISLTASALRRTCK